MFPAIKAVFNVIQTMRPEISFWQDLYIAYFMRLQGTAREE
jgi:hypothetical protein